MRISAVGNCQVEAITRALRQALSERPDVEVRYVASYAAASAEDKLHIASSDIILEQVTDRPPKSLSEVLRSATARRVLVPLLSCNFLYPFSNRPHPRAKTAVSAAFPNGCYESQLSDTTLVDLMAQHPNSSAEEIADAYLALDFAKLVPLDDLLELNRLKNERAGAIAGLNLWPRIEALFRYEPLFWTTLHPARTLMQPLCSFALEAIDIGLSAQQIASAARSVDEYRCAHLPVHPSLVRHFGITWATPDYGYKFLQEGAFTAREFAIRFVNFEFDSELPDVVERVCKGSEPAQHINRLIELLPRHAQSAELYSALSGGFARIGDVPQSLAAAIAALEIDVDNRELIPLVCRLVRMMLPQDAFPLPAREKSLSEGNYVPAHRARM